MVDVDQPSMDAPTANEGAQTVVGKIRVRIQWVREEPFYEGRNAADAIEAVLDLHEVIIPPRTTAKCKACGEDRWDGRLCATLRVIAEKLDIDGGE